MLRALGSRRRRRFTTHTEGVFETPHGTITIYRPGRMTDHDEEAQPLEVPDAVETPLP